MHGTLDISYVSQQIKNTERRAECASRHAREAGKTCVRAGLLRLCSARKRER